MTARAAHLSPQAREVLPAHVAVIMDGNGRWAKANGLPRVEGHRRGVDSARAVIRTAAEAGIKYLTLYTFSAENWNRPQDEVASIMRLLALYLKRELRELDSNHVRLETIGQIHRLPEAVRMQLDKTRAALAHNQGMTLILALSYSSRAEIVDAVRALAQKVKDGKMEPGEIDEKAFAHHLHTRHTPDPDLLIRTGGEMRLSNFLLWQISYSELLVTPVAWPEFRAKEFMDALEEYACRHRRFGTV